MRTKLSHLTSSIALGTAIIFSAASFVSIQPSLVHAETTTGKTAAQDFELKDTHGKTVKLSDLKGKVVVLEWTNPDCPFVKRHYEEGTMDKLASKYADKGVVWYAVNSSKNATSESNKKWKEEHKVSFEILDDSAGTVGKAYGAKTTPHLYVIDKDGKVAYQGAIDDDKEGEKSASERLNYVDQALAELTSGKPVSTASTTSYGCSVKYAS